jgi:putative phosphoribosyl transferase
MGAIPSGGVRELNREVLGLLNIAPQDIEEVTRREQRELEHRGDHAYRGHRPPLDVHERLVLLVDDGLATGTTMRAGISALRKLGAKSVVAAIPVGASQSCDTLRGVVDQLVCLVEPDDLVAISVWYDRFPQTTDQEVQDLLKKAEPGLLHELAGCKYVF